MAISRNHGWTAQQTGRTPEETPLYRRRLQTARANGGRPGVIRPRHPPAAHPNRNEAGGRAERHNVPESVLSKRASGVVAWIMFVGSAKKEDRVGWKSDQRSIRR